MNDFEYTGLIIFLAVAIGLIIWAVIRSKKKTVTKPNPAPIVNPGGTGVKPEVYMGESNPSQGSAINAFKNVTATRRYYAARELTLHDTVYNHYTAEPTVGNEKWIGLIDTKGSITAVKLSNAGIILELVK